VAAVAVWACLPACLPCNSATGVAARGARVGGPARHAAAAGRRRRGRGPVAEWVSDVDGTLTSRAAIAREHGHAARCKRLVLIAAIRKLRLFAGSCHIACDDCGLGLPM
jgi:hypothetical protein